MNAPSIDQLRDIHLPPPPLLWPLDSGWWALAAAFAAAALLWATRRGIRRRPLRTALRELRALEQAYAASHDAVALARGLMRVLRGYALWRYPLHGTAGLAGREWLQFLDEHGGAGGFTHGAGALLEALPYRPPHHATAPDTATMATVIALARRWLRANAP